MNKTTAPTDTLHVGLPRNLYIDLTKIAYRENRPVSAVARMAIVAFVSAITGKKYTLAANGSFRRPVVDIPSEFAESEPSSQNMTSTASIRAAVASQSPIDAVRAAGRAFAGGDTSESIVDALVPNVVAALVASGIIPAPAKSSPAAPPASHNSTAPAAATTTGSNHIKKTAQ